MGVKITPTYITEKLDAYNTAIDALLMHESASDVPGLSRQLREKLAKKLENEARRWHEQNAHKDIEDKTNA